MGCQGELVVTRVLCIRGTAKWNKGVAGLISIIRSSCVDQQLQVGA